MGQASLEPLLRGEFVCPACGARQALDDHCRRCRADLALVRRTASHWLSQRERCLRALAAGRVEAALRAARQCHALYPGGESARLLAVCFLLHGDFPAALAARRGVASPARDPT